MQRPNSPNSGGGGTAAPKCVHPAPDYGANAALKSFRGRISRFESPRACRTVHVLYIDKPAEQVVYEVLAREGFWAGTVRMSTEQEGELLAFVGSPEKIGAFTL